MIQKLVKFATLILSASFIFSCASGPKFTKIQPNMVAESPELGRIFFYRPSAFGAAVQPDVLLNNEKVGKAISHGFFYVDRPPGDYGVVTSTEVKRKVSFNLDRGETCFIRFSISPGFFVGHVYGELIEESKALPELKNCQYIGESK